MLRRNFLFGMLLAPIVPAIAKASPWHQEIYQATTTEVDPVWYELHGGITWTHDWETENLYDAAGNQTHYLITGVTDRGVSIVTPVKSNRDVTMFLRDMDGYHSSCGSSFFMENAYRLEPDEIGIEMPEYWEPRTKYEPEPMTYIKHKAKVADQHLMDGDYTQRDLDQSTMSPWWAPAGFNREQIKKIKLTYDPIV